MLVNPHRPARRRSRGVARRRHTMPNISRASPRGTRRHRRIGQDEREDVLPRRRDRPAVPCPDGCTGAAGAAGHGRGRAPPPPPRRIAARILSRERAVVQVPSGAMQRGRKV